MNIDKKVAYFAGCTANYVDPDVGKATIQVLRKNGFLPVFPDQKCCGVALLATGNISKFTQHAEFNMRSLAEADCDIVTACTSCALALKHDYLEYLENSKAELVSQRTYDIIESSIYNRRSNRRSLQIASAHTD